MVKFNGKVRELTNKPKEEYLILSKKVRERGFYSLKKRVDEK